MPRVYIFVLYRMPLIIYHCTIYILVSGAAAPDLTARCAPAAQGGRRTPAGAGPGADSPAGRRRLSGGGSPSAAGPVARAAGRTCANLYCGHRRSYSTMRRSRVTCGRRERRRRIGRRARRRDRRRRSARAAQPTRAGGTQPQRPKRRGQGNLGDDGGGGDVGAPGRPASDGTGWSGAGRAERLGIRWITAPPSARFATSRALRALTWHRP